MLFWKEQYLETNSKNVPLQTFPELMQFKYNEKYKSNNFSMTDKKNDISSKNSEKSAKSIESYLIDNTPYTKKENFVKTPEKLNSLNNSDLKNVPHLNLMFKDVDFNELIASLPKNTRTDHHVHDFEEGDFEEYLNNIRSLSPLNHTSSKPLFIKDEPLFKNPIYSSYSSSEYKDADPLENLDLQSSQ